MLQVHIIYTVRVALLNDRRIILLLAFQHSFLPEYSSEKKELAGTLLDILIVYL